MLKGAYLQAPACEKQAAWLNSYQLFQALVSRRGECVVEKRKEICDHTHISPVEPVWVKAIELIEDVRIKERLDCYWIGKVRNFEELDTEEGEFVEVYSCNADLHMGPNMDLPVHDLCNSEKALGRDHNVALNPTDGQSIESFMPNTDFEPNRDHVNEVANGDCINELDNELEELLDSF
uniref:Uncharacterized protein n=1 Tax=Tanacetum cinerariifolium TaxID=118510 RepID=A0A6L2K8I8_TANCI|nr:hypothetical protein [Tanacetum cinerariifolium]